eukprot:6490474-Amphidinium_carterae.1
MSPGRMEGPFLSTCRALVCLAEQKGNNILSFVVVSDIDIQCKDKALQDEKLWESKENMVYGDSDR